MEVEPQRVDPELVAGRAATGPGVVVKMEDRDEAQDRLGEQLDRCVAQVGDHVRVSDVETETEPLRRGPHRQVTEHERAGGERLRTRVERGEVLDRDRHL